MTHSADTQSPVRLDSVYKWFERKQSCRPVLSGISFGAEPGRLHLILGPSGSGKTTLLTMMAGLQRPTSGSVSLFGRILADYGPRALQQLRARRMGFVFQDFQLIDSLSVGQNIALVLRFAGQTRSRARLVVGDMLEQFHIAHLRERRPVRLSQGEKQRVAVARAVANRAELIIADEPTASLESKQGLEVIHLLRDYAHRQRRCVIVASHDLRLVQCADTVQCLDDGILRPWDGSFYDARGVTNRMARRGYLLVRACAPPAERERES